MICMYACMYEYVCMHAYMYICMTYVCMWYREDPAYYRNESCEDHSSEHTNHHMGPGRTAEDEKHLGEILQYWWVSDDGDDNHDDDDGVDNHDDHDTWWWVIVVMK